MTLRQVISATSAQGILEDLNSYVRENNKNTREDKVSRHNEIKTSESETSLSEI